MTVVLKIDKGTAKKLVEQGKIEEEDSKDLTSEEIELNIKDGNLFIESLEEEHKKLLEISDTEGSFSVWFDLTEERKEKLKKILGP